MVWTWLSRSTGTAVDIGNGEGTGQIQRTRGRLHCTLRLPSLAMLGGHPGGGRGTGNCDRLGRFRSSGWFELILVRRRFQQVRTASGVAFAEWRGQMGVRLNAGYIDRRCSMDEGRHGITCRLRTAQAELMGGMAGVGSPSTQPTPRAVYARSARRARMPSRGRQRSIELKKKRASITLSPQRRCLDRDYDSPLWRRGSPIRCWKVTAVDGRSDGLQAIERPSRSN